MKTQQKTLLEYLAIFLLATTAIVLIGLQIKPFGWVLWGFGVTSLLFCYNAFRRDIMLIYLSLGILGLSPISTDISPSHMLFLGMLLSLAIAIPYLVSRFIYHDHTIRFPFHQGRNWYKSEIVYIIVIAIISYFLIPLMLLSGDSYRNWSVEPGIDNIVRLFIGTNALGIWDELFFICTVFALLRRHLPFLFANIIQAILFTSFLYELGFQGYNFLAIFPFALTQGYIFRKTDSLLYIITIHLTIDFILFLALIYMHHPNWMPIFFSP